jgi:hypothetical protein
MTSVHRLAVVVLLSSAVSSHVWGDKQSASTMEPSEQESREWRLRDVWKLQFNGSSTFTASQISGALSLDSATQSTVDSNIPLSDFRDTVARRIRDGYMAAGFHECRVEAVYDADDDLVRVSIYDGPRYTCAEIICDGGDDAVRQAVVATISAGKHEVPGLLITKQEKSGWAVDEPVRFDDEFVARLHDRAVETLRDFGYYFPDIRITITPSPSTATAALHVDLTGIGRRQPVDKIRFHGLTRHTPAQLLEHLNLPDKPLLDSLAFRRNITQQLIDTGRFIHVRTVSEVPFDQDHRIPLNVTVRECMDVAILGEPLSPAQQALYRLAMWMRQWPRGESDIQLKVDCSFDELPVTGGIFFSRANLDLRFSPHEGSVARIQLYNHDEQPVVDYSFVLAPDETGTVSWMDSSMWMARRRVALHHPKFSWLGRAIPVDGHDFRFGFELGLSEASDESNALELDVNPAAVIALSTNTIIDEEASSGDTLVLRIGGAALELKRASGKFERLSQSDETFAFSVSAGTGLVRDALTTLRDDTASFSNAWKADDEYASLGRYTAEELSRYFSDHDDSRLRLVADVLGDKPAMREVIGQLQHLFESKRFHIPDTETDKRISSGSFPWNSLTLQSLFPSGSLPHRLTSVATRCSQTGDTVPLTSLLYDIQRNPDYGPLSCLLAVTLNPDLALPAASIGLQRLDDASLLAELRPVLHEECVLHNLLLSTVRIVRKLDTRQFDLLMVTLQDAVKVAESNMDSDQKAALQFAVAALPLIRRNPDEDPQAVVADLVLALWHSGGRALAAQQFTFIQARSAVTDKTNFFSVSLGKTASHSQTESGLNTGVKAVKRPLSIVPKFKPFKRIGHVRQKSARPSK